MYITSNDFKTEINKPSRKFECKVMCGSKTYTNVNIVSINITGSLQPSGYTIGSAISQKATFKFINDGNVTFPSNTIELQIGLLINGAYEYIPIGKYTIDLHDSDDYTITIVSYDNMMKFESKYNGTGTTLRAIAQEICNSCGVTLGSIIPTTTVTTPTSGKYTNREIIGYIAGCMCGNAVIDRVGQLKIQKLNLSTIDKEVTTDNWFTYKNADMIFFIEKLICDTGNGKITSGSTTDTDKQLTIKNPLMTQAMLDSVKTELSNITFTGFDVKYQGDISTDLGDTVKITDRNSNALTAPLLQRTINYNGGLTENIKTEGKKKVDLASSYYANGRYGLDFDQFKFDMKNFDIRLGNFDISITDIEARLTELEDNLSNVSEYIVDTSKYSNKYYHLKTNVVITEVENRVTDWGDETIDSEASHTYTTDGIYTIKTNSNYQLENITTLKNTLIEIVRIKDNIEHCSFCDCVNLKKVGDCLGLVDGITTFEGCASLLYPANLGNKITYAKEMYRDCTSLLDCGTIPESITDATKMFMGCTSLKYMGDMANIQIADSMFNGCTSLKKFGIFSSKLTSAESMFYGCTNLNDTITLPINLKNVESMFWKCTSLNKIINLPIAVENAKSMFYGCTSMTQFEDLADHTNLVNTSGMFMACTSSTFNNFTLLAVNVTNASGMFSGCTSAILPSDYLSNNEKALNCAGMFNGCTSITSMQVYANATDCTSMLKETGVTTTSTIFPECDVSWMYSGCTSLTTMSESFLNKVENGTTQRHFRTFSDCTNLSNYYDLQANHSDWIV